MNAFLSFSKHYWVLESAIRQIPGPLLAIAFRDVGQSADM